MALIDRVRFTLRMLLLALRARPIAGGDGEGDSGGDEGEGGKSGSGGSGDDDKPNGGSGSDDDPDWKQEARKHEKAAKEMSSRLGRASKERDELLKKVEKLEDADKSDQQKALDKARKEARDEALGEAEKERRADRLEVAVTRIAAKGITIGSGDDAKTVRFEDPEDALIYVERDGTDDLFDDDGKVKTKAVEEALADLLKRKPRLAADGENRPAGDADTRKGGGGEGTEMNQLIRRKAGMR